MKPIFWIGLAVLVLGIVSLFVAVPRHEKHQVKAGELAIGVELDRKERVPPAISAAMILVGGGLIVAAVARK